MKTDPRRDMEVAEASLEDCLLICCSHYSLFQQIVETPHCLFIPTFYYIIGICQPQTSNMQARLRQYPIYPLLRNTIQSCQLLGSPFPRGIENPNLSGNSLWFGLCHCPFPIQSSQILGYFGPFFKTTNLLIYIFHLFSFVHFSTPHSDLLF